MEIPHLSDEIPRNVQFSVLFFPQTWNEAARLWTARSGHNLLHLGKWEIPRPNGGL